MVASPESNGLTPRFGQVIPNLEFQLRLARVDIAADWLGLDFKKKFVSSLSRGLQETYRHFRWVVIPHVLAADGPVIYSLPPMDKSDDWPWESWYTDGTTPMIHHVHFTKEQRKSTGSWSEQTGAPQRPPEIYEHVWFWHDDLNMAPALSTKKW